MYLFLIHYYYYYYYYFWNDAAIILYVFCCFLLLLSCFAWFCSYICLSCRHEHSSEGRTQRLLPRAAGQPRDLVVCALADLCHIWPTMSDQLSVKASISHFQVSALESWWRGDQTRGLFGPGWLTAHPLQLRSDCILIHTTKQVK